MDRPSHDDRLIANDVGGDGPLSARPGQSNLPVLVRHEHEVTSAPEAFGAGINENAPEAFARAKTKDRNGHEPRNKRKQEKKEDKEKDDNSDESDDDSDDQSGDKSAKDKKKESSEQEEDEKPKKPPLYKRPVLMIIVGVILITAIVVGIFWWLNARQYETTDDAFIDGHVVAISPNVSATVLAVHIDDNTRVKKGDLLVELDKKDFQVVVDQMSAAAGSARDKLQQAKAQLEVAKANVDEAKAEVAVAQTNADNAKRNYDRYASLGERARSQQQLDDSSSALKSQQAQIEQQKAKQAAALATVSSDDVAVKTAEADVERADADLKQSQINLGYCEIYAPQDGLVTQKNVEPGLYVQKAQPMFSIVPTDVWVTANYKETQLDLMRIGQPVDIEVDAYSDRKFTGKVESIQNGSGAKFTLLPAENATGNYVKIVQRIPVKIVFDAGQSEDKDHLLAPGMSAQPKVKVR